MTKPILLWFIAATYNEEAEIDNLIEHVRPIVNGYSICDDGSTDKTVPFLQEWYARMLNFHYMSIEHTGLPETVKHEAKERVPDGAWILMLDADERLSVNAQYEITRFFVNGDYLDWDYVYFNQEEIIDGTVVRNFQKCKLFRKEAVQFPLDNIHADDQFEGRGTYFGWTVFHRKTTTKQILRETEYLRTYKRLLDEGKIDEGRYNWLVGLHHYVKPHG